MGLTRPRFSQFDTTISSISDPITVLNKTSTLANIDIGFIFNRDGGTSSNVALFWQESSDSFVFALSANTGEVTDSVTNSNITISDYAKLTVGTLYGNIGGGSILPNVYITGSLIPAANVTYDLGSPTQKFRSAYFSGNTVYIGGESISVGTDGTWTFTSSGANVNLGAATAFNPPSANISGNVSASYFFGNGSQLSGIITSVVKIISGNSDITTYEGSNIAVSVGGVANTVIFTSSNTFIKGSLLPTANLTYDLGSPTNRFRSAYFGGNSVYVGGEGIHVASDGTWTFTSDGHNINLGVNHEFNPPSANISGNVTARYFYGNGSQLSGIRSFSNIFVSGQPPVTANNISDVITFVGGTGISITTDTANESVTFSTVSTTGAFAADNDFGLVTDAVLTSEDKGDLASTETTTFDLGTLISAEGLIYPGQLVLPSYTVSTLPSAAIEAQIIFVSNETGGAVLAFSDGTNWRRVTDRAIVS